MITAIVLMCVGVVILKVAIFNTLNTIVALFDLHMKALLIIKNEKEEWNSFSFEMSTALVIILCWGYPVGLTLLLVGVALL